MAAQTALVQSSLTNSNEGSANTEQPSNIGLEKRCEEHECGGLLDAQDYVGEYQQQEADHKLSNLLWQQGSVQGQSDRVIGKWEWVNFRNVESALVEVDSTSSDKAEYGGFLGHDNVHQLPVMVMKTCREIFIGEIISTKKCLKTYIVVSY